GLRSRHTVDRRLDVSACRGDEPYRHLERDPQALTLLAVRRVRHRHRYGPLVPGKWKCAVGLRDVAREKMRDVLVDRELRDVHERLRVLGREQTREIAFAETALAEDLAESTSALDRLAEALLDRFERKQSRTKHERPERNVVRGPAFGVLLDRRRSVRRLILDNHHRSSRAQRGAHRGLRKSLESGV